MAKYIDVEKFRDEHQLEISVNHHFRQFVSELMRYESNCESVMKDYVQNLDELIPFVELYVGDTFFGLSQILVGNVK